MRLEGKNDNKLNVSRLKLEVLELCVRLEARALSIGEGLWLR